VIAPSGRLVRHLKQAAAHRFPEGLFGVRFAHVFQFALDLAGDAGGRFVPDVLFYERLLLRWLESPGERPFAGEDVRTYDLAGALHAAIRDMKDAAVPCDPELLVDALRMATGDPASRLSALDLRKFGALLAAYRHYAEELRRLGVADRSDIFRAAADRARHVVGPLLVYGFYDMTQVQADLVTELARAVPVTLLVPRGADPETWRFGDWLYTAVPADAAEPLPAPAPPPTPEVHTAVGERDEVWLCAKHIRRLLDEGCRPEEIAVVARTLDPYLAPLAALFGEHRIPCDAPPGRALLDHPLAQAILGLFRAALDDLPRTAALDVVGHPLFRGPADRRHWDLLARSLRIGRGDVLLARGSHTYEITYRTARQVGHFPDHDELYWNVNGNGWSLSFDHISAEVLLPKRVPAAELRAEAYTGAQGARGREYQSFIRDGAVGFTSTGPRKPHRRN